MKTNKLILSLTAIALSAWVAGCKQETKTATETNPDAPKKTESVVDQANAAVSNTVAAVKDTGTKIVQDATAAGTQAVAAVTEQAKAAIAPFSAKTQELIDSAKSLFTEGKFADALAKLNQTSTTSPSPEQQSIVANLKAQIEQAMAAVSQATTNATKAATDAVNSFLKK